jgi:hypothetical protein
VKTVEPPATLKCMLVSLSKGLLETLHGRAVREHDRECHNRGGNPTSDENLRVTFLFR